MAQKKSIGRQLLDMLIDYHNIGQFVNYKLLSPITPRYGGFFHTWAKAGIKVVKRKAGKYGWEYYLETKPELIDLDNFRLMVRDGTFHIPEEPKTKTGPIVLDQLEMQI